jgi:hypothetical protein
MPPASSRSLQAASPSSAAKTEAQGVRAPAADEGSPPAEATRSPARAAAAPTPLPRDITTPAEPAASHRTVQVPKETPTPRPGSIDLQSSSLALSTPQALARRLAIGVGGGGLLAGLLLALAHHSAPTRVPIASDGASEPATALAPIATVATASTRVERAPELSSSTAATQAVEATADAGSAAPLALSSHPNTSPPTPAPVRSAPTSAPMRPVSKKRNAILGI